MEWFFFDNLFNFKVLCASNAEHTNIELLRPHEDCKIGERVSLDG